MLIVENITYSKFIKILIVEDTPFHDIHYNVSRILFFMPGTFKPCYSGTSRLLSLFISPGLLFQNPEWPEHLLTCLLSSDIMQFQSNSAYQQWDHDQNEIKTLIEHINNSNLEKTDHKHAFCSCWIPVTDNFVECWGGVGAN